MNYSKELQNKILKYYSGYYKSCGLKNPKHYIEKRLQEEVLEIKRMNRLENILNIKFAHNQKHFIFGAGTGGLAVALRKDFGCEVFGIEPDKYEFEIIQDKCKETGIVPDNFKKEFGESLSFKSSQFDFAHCFTVLEHVQDIEKCIKEMIRITKPGGCIYINTPNYKYPEERHYKIFFPTFLPKTLGYLWLLLLRKPTNFLKTIHFITEKDLNKILIKQKDIYWFRIYEPMLKENGLKGRFLNFFKFNLGVNPMQEVVIFKKKVV